jgi:hypothetical protein
MYLFRNLNHKFSNYLLSDRIVFCIYMKKYGMQVSQMNEPLQRVTIFSLEKLIVVTCIAYTIRVFIHYIHISLARYVFLTKNELKQIGLFTPGQWEIFY